MTQSEVSVILSHIISYLHLKIVTESVTKCQTSGTFASDVIFVAHRFRVFQHPAWFYRNCNYSAEMGRDNQLPEVLNN